PYLLPHVNLSLNRIHQHVAIAIHSCPSASIEREPAISRTRRGPHATNNKRARTALDRLPQRRSGIRIDVTPRQPRNTNEHHRILDGARSGILILWRSAGSERGTRPRSEECHERDNGRPRAPHSKESTYVNRRRESGSV